MPLHDRSRPDGNQGGSSDAIDGHRTTYTTSAGRMIGLEIELRGIGRLIELAPDGWPLARRAFMAASMVREIRGAVFR